MKGNIISYFKFTNILSAVQSKTPKNAKSGNKLNVIKKVFINKVKVEVQTYLNNMYKTI